MPYDASKNPWHLVKATVNTLGFSGSPVTPNDGEDLPQYCRIRVFAPAALASATIRILPAYNADAAPITLSIPTGVPVVLEYIVRRVLLTGTTAGLEIHTV